MGRVKHWGIFIVLSVLAAWQQHWVIKLLDGVRVCYDKFLHLFGTLFSNSFWGVLLQHSLVVMLLPLIVCGLCSLIYYLIQKRSLPGIFAVLWGAWVLVVSVGFRPTGVL